RGAHEPLAVDRVRAQSNARAPRCGGGGALMRHLVIAIVCVLARSAAADHEGMHMGGRGDAPSQTVTAGVSVHAAEFASGVCARLAGDFSSEFYGGSYQGVMPSVRWSYARFGAGASIAFYRLDANGLVTNGIGDVMTDVDMQLWSSGGATLGVMLGMSFPTG